MERIIICTTNMFTITQTVGVYENGKVIETAEANVDTLSTVIESLCDKYQIKKVCLSGVNGFNAKFKKEIEINPKFSKGDIKVVLL
jgi:hypothetical protein